MIGKCLKITRFSKVDPNGVGYIMIIIMNGNIDLKY
jgi:hypothetical protein